MRSKLDSLIAATLAMATLIVASTALVYASSAQAGDSVVITSVR